MDKTLSQDEVDALLQAMKSGDVQTEEDVAEIGNREEVKVQEYNFRKPRLVSADQAQGFQVIHDQFAKGLQTALFVNLKNTVEIKLIAIDQFTYGEFVLSLLNPTYMSVLTTTPNIGEMGIEINLSVIMSMIDLLLGGDGTTQQEARELTDIEMSISNDILVTILNELKSAWSGVADITFGVQSIESNPEYLQLTTAEALVMSVTLDLRVGEISGVLNLCYPFQMIQPILGKLSGRLGAKRKTSEKEDRSRQDMLSAVGRIPLGLHAVVGETPVSTVQLCNLKIGDVLCLDRRYDSPIDIYVESEHCYQAYAGQRRGKVAVQLIKPYIEDLESKIQSVEEESEES